MEYSQIVSEQITLPKKMLKKFLGKTVEIIEVKDGILLRTSQNEIKKARGVLKGSRFTSSKHMQNKQNEKRLDR